MLPPQVAERVAMGDIESLEEVPQATVAVAVVDGLAGLVRVQETEPDRALIEDLHGELDELAQRHGLERVKVVGDAYFAACGHARPYIDHAPRVVAFAADARDAVREIGSRTSDGLDLSVGIHTGPVTVGVTAATRLLYDVWGEPVTAAHDLARRAAHGEIVISEATKALLPDSTDVIRRGDGATALWTVAGAAIGDPG
jgi:adenylate cyclase